MPTTVYNATNGLLVIDEEGRTLGAGEHADVDGGGATVAEHVEAGRLVVSDRETAAKASPTRAAARPRPDTVPATEVAHTTEKG